MLKTRFSIFRRTRIQTTRQPPPPLPGPHTRSAVVICYTRLCNLFHLASLFLPQQTLQDLSPHYQVPPVRESPRIHDVSCGYADSCCETTTRSATTLLPRGSHVCLPVTHASSASRSRSSRASKAHVAGFRRQSTRSVEVDWLRKSTRWRIVENSLAASSASPRRTCVSAPARRLPPIPKSTSVHIIKR